MSNHDPNNKACPRHGQYAAKSDCTCPDHDEVEQIRERMKEDRYGGGGAALADICRLLRIVDQQAVELVEKQEILNGFAFDINMHMAELAEARAEVARLVGHIDATAHKHHESYGPCDSIAKDGTCAECGNIFDGMRAEVERLRAELETLRSVIITWHLSDSQIADIENIKVE